MKGRIKNIIYSLLPVTFLFLSGESIQRVRYYNRYNDSKWLKYGFTERFHTPKGTSKVININNSIVDYNSTELKTILNDSTKRLVACIGGSTTAGVYNSKQFKYPYLLQQHLKTIDSNYFVINAGVPSHCAYQYKGNFDRFFKTNTPEVLIIYTGNNDMFIKDVNLYYNSFLGKMNKIYQNIEYYSLLLLTIKEKFMLTKYNNLKDNTAILRKKDTEREFIRDLEQFIKYTKKRGVKKTIIIPEVIVAKQLNAMTSFYTDYEPIYQNIPHLIDSFAKSNNLKPIFLQEYYDTLEIRKHFMDPCHLTDTGNVHLAKQIFKLGFKTSSH